MREFEEKLIRLKQVLRLPEDKDVAAALGMSKAAFSARKVRGAFPDEKVKALAADRPDLGIDVKYVLTGQSDELYRRMSALSKATKIASRVADEAARYDVQAEVFELLIKELAEDELLLIHRYRNCDARGREAILATAAAMNGLGEPAQQPGEEKA